MDITAAVSIRPIAPLAEMVGRVNEALSIELRLDDSGRYEEFPAYVTRMLGFEIALLGPAPEGESTDFAILVRTYVTNPDHDVEVDISEHLAQLLALAGIPCEVSEWTTD